MPFQKGNSLWKTRSSHGRKPRFEKPQDLWDACCEYFQWVEDNPLYEDSVSVYKGVVDHEPIEKMRPMTMEGLYVFLDICETTWHSYRKKDDFVGVVTRVEHVLYEQKFSGAAAGLLNANIVARKLGISEKTESKVELTKDVEELSDEELAAIASGCS